MRVGGCTRREVANALSVPTEAVRVLVNSSLYSHTTVSARTPSGGLGAADRRGGRDLQNRDDLGVSTIQLPIVRVDTVGVQKEAVRISPRMAKHTRPRVVNASTREQEHEAEESPDSPGRTRDQVIAIASVDFAAGDDCRPTTCEELGEELLRQAGDAGSRLHLQHLGQVRCPTITHDPNHQP